MGLTKEETDALVALKVGNANKTFAEVAILIDNSLWRTAGNRLYYACFYITSALLLKNGFAARTHNGVFGLLGLHFVSKGIVSQENNRLYRKLYELRQTGDYDDWTVITKEDILPLLAPAKQFIETIEQLINEN
jgi:uncharacterized protein (UPF0332 family)